MRVGQDVSTRDKTMLQHRHIELQGGIHAMSEQRRNLRKGAKWQPVSRELVSSLGIISFHNLVRTDHIARIIDRSILGIGIETDHPISPGVVWFTESTYGQKCGVLTWCHEIDGRYRCGIRFISLTSAEEEYFLSQVEHAKPCTPIQDPDHIIDRLNACILKD